MARHGCICEASPSALVAGEIQSVQGAMRRNSRWASVPVYGRGEPSQSLANSMGLRDARRTGGAGDGAHANGATTSGSTGPISLGAFAQLQALLRDGADFERIDALVLLQPFLDVIRSGDTSGPITAAALASVDKFVTYALVHADSPNAAAAMAAISNAGTHCKFEASDSASDEVVLLKILDVLKNTLTSALGHVLTDEAVCEIMETGLSMCCQMRLSEMLRRSAERTMQALVASVFTKLQTIDESEDAIVPVAVAESVEPVDGAATEGLRVAAPDPTSGLIPAASTPLEAPTDPSPLITPTTEQPGPLPPAPYGLPSIRELLRVLISLLNPHDTQHTDSMRLMALNILNIAIEMGGRSIGRFPSLRVMVADELCKHVLQLARSENPALFAASLRVIANIFDTMREHLKLQQELFLAFVMDRLARPGERTGGPEPWDEAAAAPAPSAKEKEALSASVRKDAPTLTNEARELLLERLAQMARTKDFAPDLWTNYDSSLDCEDVCERFVTFFARGVYPSHSGGQYLQDGSQLLCLDTVLLFVNQLAARSEAMPDDAPESEASAALRAVKASKRALIEGAARFNRKPKDGLRFLEENGIIYADPTESRAQSLARFLKSSSRIDKAVLGDYISGHNQLELLKAFMHQFDFSGMIICDAMRALLETFRLPGESQPIARITETFAEVFFASQPAEIKSTDAAYVLAYSVIMLNTDQHNPQNRKRMTVEDYQRNLRGVNENSDFSPAFLKSIYDSIRRREIVLPEEHYGQLGFEYAWRELLRRSQTAGPFLSVEPSFQIDRDLFAVVWKPIVSSISYAFAHFNDDALLQRAVAGYRQCAELASRFGMSEVFDYTIAALAKITGLALIDLPDSASFPSVTTDEGQVVTVSPLSIRFGASFKAQLAAVVLFSIANNDGAAIRSGWHPIFEIYNALFVHSLLPPSLLGMEDFLAGTSPIPLKPKTAPARPRDAHERRDGGLLSTLSSYLLSPYGPTAETMGRDVTEDDVEHTLCTVDCIASCRVEDLFAQILVLPIPTLVPLLGALIRLAERHTVERLRPRAMSVGAGGGSRPSSPAPAGAAREPLAYDPSSVFLLELIVSITGKAEGAIAHTWPTTFEFLSRVLASSTVFSALLIERAVVGLLRLASVIARHEDMREQLFFALDVLRSLPVPVLHSTADQLAAGLSRVVAEHQSAIRSTTEWSLVLSLLAATAGRDEAARHSFACMESLARDGALTADNFGPYVHALDAFVAAAGARDLRQTEGSDDPVIERAKAALDLLRDVHPLVERLVADSSMPRTQGWETFWLPVLSVYAQQSTTPCREVRQTALASLQRTLVSPEVLVGGDVDLVVVFERLIFPTIDELLKPQVFRRDPTGMGETRLRASTLLCKIFLHHLTRLERQGMAGMTALWVRIIGCLDRMMHSGRRDQMYEAVPEMLKNVLLVMQAHGVLAPPHVQRTAEQVQLWDATWTRIDSFLPSLQRELFPPQPVGFAPAPAPSQGAQAA